MTLTNMHLPNNSWCAKARIIKYSSICL